MQQSEFNVPCIGRFQLRVDEDFWDMEVPFQGVMFRQTGVNVPDILPPVLDIRTNVVLDIPLFVWQGIADRLREMFIAEKREGTMPMNPTSTVQ